MDRKTVRRYLELAAYAGRLVARDWGRGLPPRARWVEEIIESRRLDPSVAPPGVFLRLAGEGQADPDQSAQIRSYGGGDVTYSTHFRFARKVFGFGGPKVTVRMVDTAPGKMAQVQFYQMGLFLDPETAKAASCTPWCRS